MQPIQITYKGEVTTHRVTPLNEYNFERHFEDGIGPTLSKGRNSDVYWLAWEVLRSSGVDVPAFGPEFLGNLDDAEFVEEPTRPNG